MKLLPIERRVGGSNVHPETIVTEIVAYAQVDDNHHNHLRQFRWTQGNGGYPRRRAAGKKIVFLHQEVMQLAGIPAGRQTDHIDGDVLNNQTSNLRPASHRENGANRKLGKDSKTGYKGVSFDSRRGKYQVMLRVHGVMRFFRVLPSSLHSRPRLRRQGQRALRRIRSDQPITGFTASDRRLSPTNPDEARVEQWTTTALP